MNFQKIGFSLVLVTSLSAQPLNSLNADQKPFWMEKDSNSSSLVNLPNLGPVIDQVDAAIVNIATSSEAKPAKQRPMGPQGAPEGDPFSNPEEFFQRFFGNPFREQQRQPRRSLGSGFLISKDGYIVTNNHVIEGADKIEVTIFTNESAKGTTKAQRTGDKFEAKIVGRDPATDLALIKIDAKRELPYAPLGNSTRLRKGDWVLAFGNPFGLDHSVSLGIVSATGREISPNENRRFDDFIQTDAAINFGNSGGPLVNLRGEVIGVNTAITAQGSGIGFAVPVNILKDVLPQLKDSRTVARGYLGVMIQDVTDEMKDALGLTDVKGVLVNDMVPGGPAAKSQLKRGDVIVKVNDTDVHEAKDLQKTVARVKPGASVNLKVIRDKKAFQLPVKVGNLQDDSEKPNANEPDPKADRLGLVVGPIPDGKGVVVQDVGQNSPSAAAGVIPGDIIREVNGKPIASVKEYEKIVTALKSKSTVLIDLERRNLKLFVAFRVP